MGDSEGWPADLLAYTQEQWKSEMKARHILVRLLNGTVTWFGTELPCPDCAAIGFFGAKEFESEGRKYRACKFCGFWQEAAGAVLLDHGGEPYRCEATRCDTCVFPLNYSRQNPWASEVMQCEHCKAKMRVVKRPTEDPGHPCVQVRDEIVDALANLGRTWPDGGDAVMVQLKL